MTITCSGIYTRPGFTAGASITLDGLVLNIDANNPKSKRGFDSLLNLSTWTLGTGDVSGFTARGLTTENQRVLDTNPFGEQSIVWESPSNDEASDADGGWDSSKLLIDPTKMYRLSVWIRKKDITGIGRAYLGTYAYDNANTNTGVLVKSTGDASTNFYFGTARFDTELADNVSTGEWVLFVGHIWPVGSATGASHPDSGIWKLSGQKIHAFTDCILPSGAVRITHRSYQYYSTTTTEKQQWYQPRIDLVDGTEPTLQQLLSGVGSYFVDSKSGHRWAIRNTASMYDSTERAIAFDGIDDRCHPTISHSYLDSSTIEVAFKSTNNGSGKRTIIGYRHNEGYEQPPIGSLYLDNGTLKASVITASQAYRTAGTASIATNTPYVAHLVKDVTNGLLTIYVNGQQAGQISFDSSTYAQWPTAGTYIGANVLDIGKATNSTQTEWQTDFFHGFIYSVKIYSRALSQTEVSKNFNAVRSRYGI